MDKLNMSLDEIAAQRRKQNRGRGRGRGLRPGFRGRNRGRPVQNRQRPVRKGNTRLRISNLNKAITNEELKKIFAEYGKLTRCGVHFNKMGESQGTGDIEYETHEEAEKALQKLNNADVGGEVMKVAYAVRKRARSAPLRGRRNERGRKRYERPERRRRSTGQRQSRRENGSRSQNRRRVQRFKKTVGRRRRQ